MSVSSSDSDCFESADEEFHNEIVSVDNNAGPSDVKNDSCDINFFLSPEENERLDNSEAKQENYHSKGEIQYRKRPERRKNKSKAETSNTRKVSLKKQIFQSQIMKSDLLIQNLTSNLSKNLNKGFNTIQQTSSSIKDLVMSSLPVNTPTERRSSSKFSYDDDDDEEEVEEEIASYLPSYEKDCNTNKHGEETSGLFNKYVEDTLKLKKKELQPCLQVCTNEAKIETKESNDNYENIGLVPKTNGEKLMSQEPKNDLEHNFEKFEVFKDFERADDFGKGIKREAGQQVPDLNLNVDKKESVMKGRDEKMKGDEEENILKDESGCLNQEIGDENLRLQLAVTEDLGNITHGNNDGWDTSELQLGELNIKESPEASSFEEEPEKSNIISGKSETKDALPTSSCNEGWDDFDFDDEELRLQITESQLQPSGKYQYSEINKSELPGNDLKFGVAETESIYNSSKWSGWDNFGEKQETQQKSGWALGNWGVNALLNTATSVTQGLSNVLEVGLGAPDPETLAKREMESIRDMNENRNQQKEISSPVSEESLTPNSKLFPGFGITNLVAGVTKNIVEHTRVHEIGSKVISGGLDTLESFGKKTMEVLQEGDPGLKKKRALLLGTDKPTLSHVLREVKAKAEIENKKMEKHEMTKLCHFETLFDDFQGLVYLEALEMLSRQCELKLEQLKESMSVQEVEDMNDTLDEVKELCVIDEDEFKSNYSGMVDFKISLKKATEPLKKEISVQKIIQIYEECNAWFKSEKGNMNSSVNLFEKAMTVLAELTAATVQQFHKSGELLSVKEHRKTVEEADTLLQMTGVLCCEIDHITEKFLNLCTSQLSDNDEGIKNKIKDESGNATLYIKDAFNLLIPVLQLGATT